MLTDSDLVVPGRALGRRPLHKTEVTGVRVKQYLWGSKATCRWTTACVSDRPAHALSSALLRFAQTGLVLCPGLCVTIGESRPGPGASPLWHTFSAAPPAWLSLLSKGGWCTFRKKKKKKKQTKMEAVGVQVYRPCSFDCLWVWWRSILLACMKDLFLLRHLTVRMKNSVCCVLENTAIACRFVPRAVCPALDSFGCNW